ncbi:MAG: IPT/TIG domain-containing protein [Oscillochloridaceae bacterium]|nr:IPT/TIG domain-containing protein [Chloroflexaceae bacterium]MDW8389020.1 IPT/TIG domain-containing protein [Oscillochloridaceae bacterium]
MNRYVILALVLCLALAGGAASLGQPPASALAGPVVLQVTPSQVYNTTASEVTIKGSGFVATPVVTLTLGDQAPIVLSQVRFVDYATLVVTIPAETPEGAYVVTVYNPDGSSHHTGPAGLTVVRPGDQRMRAWMPTTPLPGGRFAFAAVATAGNVYVIGGLLGGGSDQTVVQARIMPDGRLGPWQDASQLNRSRGGIVGVVSGEYIYVIGGAIGAGLPTERTIERARVAPDGALGPWEVIGELPEVRYGAAGAVVGEYLFIMDGRTVVGDVSMDTIRARIAPDGTPGPWVEVAPTRGRSVAAASSGQAIFVLNDDGSIERSRMNADGSLEPWTTVAPTRVNHRGGALAVFQGSLVVLGGSGGAPPNVYSLTNVERADIRSDGSLGPWTSAPSLLTSRSAFSVATSNQWLYAIGSTPSYPSIPGEQPVEFSGSALPPRLYMPLIGRE